MRDRKVLKAADEDCRKPIDLVNVIHEGGLTAKSGNSCQSSLYLIIEYVWIAVLSMALIQKRLTFKYKCPRYPSDHCT